MDAARPTLIVETSALTCHMVSNIAKPAVTEPGAVDVHVHRLAVVLCVIMGKPQRLGVLLSCHPRSPTTAHWSVGWSCLDALRVVRG